MKKQNRLFEVFQHVTGVKLNEGDLEYAHIDQTTPNDQTSSIGSEIGDIQEEESKFPINVAEAKKSAKEKKEKSYWEKHKKNIEKEDGKEPKTIEDVLDADK